MRSTPSALGADTLDDRLALFSYSVDPVAVIEDIDACERILAAVQRELGRRGVGRVLDLPAALELAGARFWALRALSNNRYMTARWLREIEMAAAGGTPLAICVGGLYSVPPLHGRRPPVGPITFLDCFGAEHTFPFVGCNSIFEDVGPAGGGGRKFARLCPDCQPNRGRRRSQQLRLRRYVNDLFW